MDDIKTRLNDALKQAMVNKDTATRMVIRVVQSEAKQIEVDERRDLTNDDYLTVIQREVKRRQESMEEARKGGRDATIEELSAEIRILEQFLPAQLSRAEIEALAREAIAQSGASSPKEMGKVMAVLMPKVKGAADGKLVNEVVRGLLSQ